MAWSWSPGRDVVEEATGSPKFLGNLNHPFAVFQTDAGRTAGYRPQYSSLAPGHHKAEAPTKGLSTLNSTAFVIAVYASQSWSSNPTQDSLPIAGQALLDGVLIRKVPMKVSKLLFTSHSPFPSFACNRRSLLIVVDNCLNTTIDWRRLDRGQ